MVGLLKGDSTTETKEAKLTALQTPKDLHVDLLSGLVKLADLTLESH